MARRIRPKVRDKPAPVRDKKGRIKIRMRRESSDLLQLALKAAKKEASKEAGFKGFKSGVKSATNKAKKAKEVMMREIDRERELHRLAQARADILTQAIERVVMSGHVSCDVFAQQGVPLERYKNNREAMYRWRVTWSNVDAPARSVVRDGDGVDRVQTTMQRHRLHPGHRIRVADMHVIWESVPNTELPTIDPIQGIRGAWYWNMRRYSSHSSAMNAWRRVMHNRAEMNVPHTLDSDIEEESDDVDEMRVREHVSPHQLDHTVLEPTEDDLEEADSAPTLFYEDADDFANRGEGNAVWARSMRNRLNILLRDHGLRSCSFWERSYRLHIAHIEDRNDLSAWGEVAASFEVPLYDWDGESYNAFCAAVSTYLEETQSGAEYDMTGLRT